MKIVSTLTLLLISAQTFAGAPVPPTDGVPTTIPEPSMLALFAIGAAALFFARRRK